MNDELNIKKTIWILNLLGEYCFQIDVETYLILRRIYWNNKSWHIEIRNYGNQNNNINSKSINYIYNLFYGKEISTYIPLQEMQKRLENCLSKFDKIKSFL